MSQSLLRVEEDPSDSDDRFSLEEGPSFCSRPTPVTAVPEALRGFGMNGTSVEQSGIVPRSSPRPESARPSRPSTELEQAFFDGPKPSLPPSLPPPVVRPPVSRGRTVVSLLLFVTLFGGVAALLGIALLQKVGLAPGTVMASLQALVATVL